MQVFQSEITNLKCTQLEDSDGQWVPGLNDGAGLITCQEDVGTKFKVILTDSGEPFSLGSGALLSLWYIGSSGEGNYSQIDGRSPFVIEGNTVEVELVTQMLSCPGSGTLWLILSDAQGNRTTLCRLEYITLPGPDSQSAAATEYYTAFSEYVQRSEAAAKKAELLADGLTYGHNLLDNSDFTNPVNQRGAANYSGAAQYTIDRWKTTNENTTVTISESGITLTNTTSGGAGYLLQIVEKPKRLLGKTLTLAVELADGTVICGSCTLPTAFPSANTVYLQLYDGDLTIGGILLSAASVWVRIWSNASENSRSFKWAALYEGEYTVDTLPPYVPKGYGAELAECLRYYEKLTMGCTQFTLPYNSTYIAVQLQYYPKRTNPTVTANIVGTDCMTVAGVGTAACTSVTAAHPVGPTSCRLNINGSWDTTKLYSLLFSAVNIEVSADL